MATETPATESSSTRVGAQTIRSPRGAVWTRPAVGLHARPSARYLLTRTVPSWLSSVIIHAVLLLVLALVYFRAPVKPMASFIAIDPTRAEEELQELQQPEELDPVDKVSLSLSPVIRLQAETQEEVPEIVLSSDPSATPTRVELSELSDRTMPRQELLHEVQALAGEALAGRGAHQRGQMIAQYGGSAGSERAVAMALKWFAEHQRPDGSWSLDHRDGPCKGRCSQPGKMQSCFSGGTALALLPFLGAGQTHEQGTYKEQVDAGLKYLLRTQGRPNGSLVSGGGSLYSHGLASIVLCEAYAMTKDRQLEAPARAALRYIVYTQDRAGGGWRYFPRQPGDTSVVGWQLMALKSGHMGKLEVPGPTVAGVSRFLDSVQVDGGSLYGYTGPVVDKPSMTAVGLLCRMYLGWNKDHLALQRGVKRISDHAPATNEAHTKFHMYYNYYATQVMRHYGGPPWEKWNAVMRDMLVHRQETTGHEAGSWDIPDWDVVGAHDTDNGGRLYYTSLATMILEVYYRHMPIYGEQAAEDEFPL